MSEEPPAEDLLARVARRDVAALSELYDRFAPSVYGLVARIVSSRSAAEESLRQVFVRLWAESPQLSEQGRSVAAWLIVTGRETALGHLRDLQPNSRGDGMPSAAAKPAKEKPGAARRTKAPPRSVAPREGFDERNVSQRISVAEAGRTAAIGALPSTCLPQPREIDIIDDRLALLHKVINQLPKPQRQALELAVFHGMRESEIAAQIGEPLGKVSSSLRAAVTYVKHRRRAVCGSWAANI
jgi:RNA polymerase sigma factor (sigma-70 family)